MGNYIVEKRAGTVINESKPLVQAITNPTNIF